MRSRKWFTTQGKHLHFIPHCYVLLALSAGLVGLTLSYAIKIPGVFQQCVKQSAEVENLVSIPQDI